MPHLTRTVTLVVAIAIFSGGCIDLKSPPDPTRFYILNGTIEEERINLAGTGLVVHLRRVELDEYLDSPYMVSRKQAYELQFSDIHRWGEDLSTNIRRALKRDLIATGIVDEVVEHSRDDVDYSVSIAVHRFEAVPPDVAHLAATWTITGADGEIVHVGHTDDHNEGWILDNYGHLAQKLDESLNTMAVEIAKTIAP